MIFHVGVLAFVFISNLLCGCSHACLVCYKFVTTPLLLCVISNFIAQLHIWVPSMYSSLPSFCCHTNSQHSASTVGKVSLRRDLLADTYVHNNIHVTCVHLYVYVSTVNTCDVFLSAAVICSLSLVGYLRVFSSVVTILKTLIRWQSVSDQCFVHYGGTRKI